MQLENTKGKGREEQCSVKTQREKEEKKSIEQEIQWSTKRDNNYGKKHHALFNARSKGKSESRN